MPFMLVRPRAEPATIQYRRVSSVPPCEPGPNRASHERTGPPGRHRPPSLLSVRACDDRRCGAGLVGRPLPRESRRSAWRLAYRRVACCMRRAGQSAAGANADLRSLRLGARHLHGCCLAPASRQGARSGPGGERKFRRLEAKPDNTQTCEGTSQIRRMGMARQLIRLKAGHRQAISWNFCRAGHPAALKCCVDAHGAVYVLCSRHSMRFAGYYGDSSYFTRSSHAI